MDFWVTVTQLVERHVSWQCSEHHQWNPTHRYCIGVETEGDILKPGHAEPKLSAWIETVFGWRGCERTIWVDCRLMGVGLQRVSITLSHWDATLCTSVGDAQVQFVSACVLVHLQCVWIMWVCDCKANIMTDWHRGLNWIIKQHDWLITSLN